MKRSSALAARLGWALYALPLGVVGTIFRSSSGGAAACTGRRRLLLVPILAAAYDPNPCFGGGSLHSAVGLPCRRIWRRRSRRCG